MYFALCVVGGHLEQLTHEAAHENVGNTIESEVGRRIP